MLLVLTAVFQALLILTSATREREAPDIDEDSLEGPLKRLGDTVEVTLETGVLKGKVIRLPNAHKVECYLGVPYAEPPVGKLRFRAPVPKTSWVNEGVLETTEFGPLCLQDRQRQTWDIAFDHTGRRYMKKITLKKYRQSEDCLTLNIYTSRNSNITEEEDEREGRPEEQREEIREVTDDMVGSSYSEEEGQEGQEAPLLPVMVYFHGGSYQMSGGRFYPGEWLAWMGRVVVVTLNYRLGPFGFLSTGDHVVQGNAGLLDQLMALQWVRNNIRAFGGHPGRVTIFGNSAGGACVGLHLLSPLSNGLFTTAIAQSGSAVAKWAVQRHPKRQAQRLARDVGCIDVDNSEAIYKCLKAQPAELIIRKAGIPVMSNAMSIRFAPVVESHFLPGDPETLIRKGKAHPVPLMTGLTRDEVSVWMSHYNNPSTIRLTKQKVKKYLHHLLSENSTTDANLEALVHAVYTEYTRKKPTLDPTAASITAGRPTGALTLAEIISDVGLKAPGVHLAKLLSKQSSQPVYLYEFDYSSQDDITIQNSSWVGAYHESELHYLFGLPFLDLKNSLRLQEDKQVSKSLIKMWTDFAKFGSPTPESSSVNFTWQQYLPGQHKYATLGSNHEMRRLYKERRMTFWNSFIPLFTEHGMEITKHAVPCPPEELIGVTVALIVMGIICLLLIGYIICMRKTEKTSLVLQASPTLV